MISLSLITSGGVPSASRSALYRGMSSDDNSSSVTSAPLALASFAVAWASWRLKDCWRVLPAKTRSLVMAYCHVAHDCIVGDNCVLANNVSLAGHIEVGNFVVLGGMAAVHQFVKIGDHVMVGGYSKVRTDVPPFVKAARDPLAYVGINATGLKRRGFDQNRVHHIQDIYRILFVHGSNVKRSIENIENNIIASDDKDYILTFLKDSKRGLIKGI